MFVIAEFWRPLLKHPVGERSEGRSDDGLLAGGKSDVSGFDRVRPFSKNAPGIRSLSSGFGETHVQRRAQAHLPALPMAAEKEEP
jgi:hypothetical protein